MGDFPKNDFRLWLLTGVSYEGNFNLHIESHSFFMELTGIQLDFSFPHYIQFMEIQDFVWYNRIYEDFLVPALIEPA